MELNTPKKNWLPPCTNFENLGRTPALTDFEKVKKLGRGAYGQVFQVKVKNTDREFAMKVITKQTIENLRMIDQLKNEFNILRKLNHPNIIKLSGFFEDERNIYFILELADEDHLYSKLNKVEKYDEATAARYMFEMFQAVNYLHTQDPAIIHRDIKPENILFVKGSLKLADFGWSNMKDQKARTTYCGTPDYLAPEMVMDKAHNEKLDVWTLGVLLYELVVGKAPFTPSASIKDKRQAQKELSKNIIECKPRFPTFLSPICVAFISKLLKKDFNARPSAAEALQDPFFTTNGLKFESAVKYDMSQTKPATTPSSKEQSASLGQLLLSAQIPGVTPKSTAETSKISSGTNVTNKSTELNQSGGISSAMLTETLVNKLPSSLSSHYNKDNSKFIRDLVRSWLDLKEGESNMQNMLEAKNQAFQTMISNAQSNLQTPEGKKLNQDDINSLFAELKETKLKQIEQADNINRLEKEKENLFNKCIDLEKKCLEIRTERDELLMEKNRITNQVEDLQSSQVVLRDDWVKEQETLRANNKQMENILSNNPQTRPALIQNSLLKVAAIMEGINQYYLGQVETNSKGTALVTQESHASLLAEKQRVEARLKELEAELETRIKSAQETADLEFQATLRQHTEEYRLKKDKEVELLEKELDEAQKVLSDVAILKEQVAGLKIRVEDRDKQLGAKKLREESLVREIKGKAEGMEMMESTIKKMMEEIQNLKTENAR